MSKLDWEKAKKVNNWIDHSQGPRNQYDAKDVALKLSSKAGTWPGRDKYHGTPIQQIPLQHLGLVCMAVKVDSPEYKIALLEIQRRAIVERKNKKRSTSE